MQAFLPFKMDRPMGQVRALDELDEHSRLAAPGYLRPTGPSHGQHHAQLAERATQPAATLAAKSGISPCCGALYCVFMTPSSAYIMPAKNTIT